ncbi:MAG: J domain-containing protein [Actinobacteria bacterium]|nr:J domain-containing protein [Actinomycetota bacterium]
MIPKEWEGSNYYQVLGVSPSASFSQIKAAYRQLAQQLHPDRNQGQIGPTEFQQLSQAYKVLSKEKSRALYDDYLFGATQIPIRDPEPQQSFLTMAFSHLSKLFCKIIQQKLIQRLFLVKMALMVKMARMA